MRYHLFFWVLSFLLWYILFSASFCAHIFPYGTVALIIQLIFFQIIWILAICSLFSTTLITPAEIPKRFMPPKDIFEKRNFVKEIVKWANEVNLPVHCVTMSTEGGDIKCPPFCLYCKVIKPNRTHHCRRCNRCIIRMDHHCPIIGRCIHMHNHKFFLLFLFWAAVLCGYAVYVTLPALFQRTSIVIWNFSGMISAVIPGYVQRAPPSIDRLVSTCLVASGALNALICGISLSIFLGQLMHSLLRNETTLESTTFQFCGDNNDQHITDNISYDLGSVWKNFCSIFGYNPLLWLLPIQTTYGNGLFFNEDALKKKVNR
uniref:Palmitoyltransferase n=1 Tax=Onchocerca volvulus TaxID=6282 RepID=A0A2K6WKJ1_ONCVO